MVSASGPRDREEYYDDLQEKWPSERPSRKRLRREYRRKRDREVVVSGKRLREPSTAHMSRAMLLAQRELAQAKAEQEARTGDSHAEDAK